VEYPDTVIVKPVADWAVICEFNRTGALAGNVRIKGDAFDGVRLNPLVVAKDGVSVIVPATVPVWIRICGLALKSAVVLFARIAKFTLVPPEENCTAGSAAN
jgi:hypothetical protein